MNSNNRYGLITNPHEYVKFYTIISSNLNKSGTGIVCKSYSLTTCIQKLLEYSSDELNQEFLIYEDTLNTDPVLMYKLNYLGSIMSDKISNEELLQLVLTRLVQLN